MAWIFVCVRCPAYSGLPQYCHLQPDPNDACCKVPVCTVGGNQLVVEIGGTPTVSPTLDPSVNNVVPLGTHTILTGSTHLPGVGVQTMFGGRCEWIHFSYFHLCLSPHLSVCLSGLLVDCLSIYLFVSLSLYLLFVSLLFQIFINILNGFKDLALNLIKCAKSDWRNEY